MANDIIRNFTETLVKSNYSSNKNLFQVYKLNSEYMNMKYNESTEIFALKNSLNGNYRYLLFGNWTYISKFVYLLIIVGLICDIVTLLVLILNIIDQKLYFKCLFRYKSSRNDNNRRPNENVNNYNKNNYVTIAFMTHQITIDIIRIAYCYFYMNNLNKPLDQVLESTYQKYCMQFASFYSILTMVTLINILAIFICETCRFYDLKLNSNDTSNIFCVMFGVMLIWFSSLIIISSIMLIGVASAAAPSNCILFEQINNSTITRRLVVNIIWLFIVCLIICIAIFYFRSLYKELNSLEYKHHRISIYALYKPVSTKSTHFKRRHFFIVKQTSKRLVVLLSLIVLICITWFPNFVFILLQLIMKENDNLKFFSLLSSIVWLLNPSFNSFVFLYVFYKEHKMNYYNMNGDNDDDDDETYYNTSLFNRFKLRVIELFKFDKCRNAKFINNQQLSNDNENSMELSEIDGDNNERKNECVKPMLDVNAMQTKIGNKLCNVNSDLLV